MPGSHDSMYYSIDIGPAHFILFSTEVYIAFETLERDLVQQYNWLVEDLKVTYTHVCFIMYVHYSLVASYFRRSTKGTPMDYCYGSSSDVLFNHQFGSMQLQRKQGIYIYIYIYINIIIYIYIYEYGWLIE